MYFSGNSWFWHTVWLNVSQKITFLKKIKFRGPNIIYSKRQKKKPLFNTSAPSVQFSSVAQSCPTLCDPMNCSTPGLPVYHQLSEFTQTHVHWVGDAIQPSPPLSSPSPALNLSHLSNESVLCIRWPKYWSFSFNISPSNEHPGLISFRMD